MSFVGESGSGHSIVMDGAPDSGGRNLAARPMEIVLIGMGGCTAFDVVMILQKARQPISDCIVELSAERADEIPKVFTKIHAHYIVISSSFTTLVNLNTQLLKQGEDQLKELRKISKNGS